MKIKKDGTVIIGTGSILFKFFNLGYIFKFDNKTGMLYVRSDDENRIIKIALKEVAEVSYTLKYGNMVISFLQEGRKRLQDILFSIKGLTQADRDFLVKFFISADKKVVNTDERTAQKARKAE